MTPSPRVAKQAVVLCGGKGTRLRTLTQATPKALCVVGRQPFLDVLLNSLHD
jgi:NDP-sugar pyrophosphorylase family protein